MPSGYCYISYIPQHILKLILSKLPFLTLLQCKFVCKLWNSILLEPDFPKLHFLSQEKDSINTLMLCIDGTDLYWLQLRDRSQYSFTCAAKFQDKYKSQPFDLSFFNSCKGFLYVYEYDRQDFEGHSIVHILNPVTDEFINLPSIEKGQGLDFDRCVLGFSPKTNQFKVLMATYPFGVDEDIPENQFYDAQIHTIGCGGSWRKIEAIMPTYEDGSEWHSFNVFVNGSFHWLVVSDDGESAIEICAFDFDDERFQSIPLPSSIDEDYNYGWSNIGVFKEETLYFTCFKNYLQDSVEVWVMNEYGVTGSWVKTFVIENQSKLWNAYALKVIKLFEDGDILLLCDNNVFLYDPQQKNYKRWEVDGVQSCTYPFIHQPSFVRFRDILVDDNISVFSASLHN